MAGLLKRLLKQWTRADRPLVIAVIGITREDVQRGIAHALTSNTRLPIQAWCAVAADPAEGELAGCERFTSGACAGRVRRELRLFWPALVLVSWRGERGSLAHKLIPFTVPPFRFVVANEAGGYFAARPGALAGHGARRLRDACISAARRLADWAGGACAWLWSGVLHTGDRLWSLWLSVLGRAAKCTPRIVRAVVGGLPNGPPSP